MKSVTRVNEIGDNEMYSATKCNHRAQGAEILLDF
jgi:hypothetical protein